MVDDVPLRKAVHTVWSLYLAKRRDVDAAAAAVCSNGICRGDGKLG